MINKDYPPKSYSNVFNDLLEMLCCQNLIRKLTLVLGELGSVDEIIPLFRTITGL